MFCNNYILFDSTILSCSQILSEFTEIWFEQFSLNQCFLVTLTKPVVVPKVMDVMFAGAVGDGSWSGPTSISYR